MFRCDNCGSGFSAQAASSWEACPRCLAKEKIQVPLTFELGWQRQGAKDQAAPSTTKASGSLQGDTFEADRAVVQGEARRGARRGHGRGSAHQGESRPAREK